MQFFNVGLGEIIFILIIAGVAPGPERMVSFARKAGKFAHQVASSSLWRDVMATSIELRKLPQKLIQESELDEDIKNLRKDVNTLNLSTLNTILEEDNQVSEERNFISGAVNSPSNSDKNLIVPPKDNLTDDNKSANH